MIFIQGVNPSLNYHISREATYRQFEDSLLTASERCRSNLPLILIRAPPQSGKTSFIQLAMENMKNWHVVRYSKFTLYIYRIHLFTLSCSVSVLCSSNCTNQTFGQFLTANMKVKRTELLHSECTFYDLWKTSAWLEQKPVLLFVDEAQAVYYADYAREFWEKLKRHTIEFSEGGCALGVCIKMRDLCNDYF